MTRPRQRSAEGPPPPRKPASRAPPPRAPPGSGNSPRRVPSLEPAVRDRAGAFKAHVPTTPHPPSGRDIPPPASNLLTATPKGRLATADRPPACRPRSPSTSTRGREAPLIRTFWMVAEKGGRRVDVAVELHDAHEACRSRRRAAFTWARMLRAQRRGLRLAALGELRPSPPQSGRFNSEAVGSDGDLPRRRRGDCPLRARPAT